MALKAYGVLAGRVVDRWRASSTASTPHHQILMKGDAATACHIAVNVKSQESPSELFYLADPDFGHPLTASLPAGPSVERGLPTGPGGTGLASSRQRHRPCANLGLSS
jgi:uncharacterized protein YukJ